MPIRGCTAAAAATAACKFSFLPLHKEGTRVRSRPRDVRNTYRPQATGYYLHRSSLQEMALGYPKRHAQHERYLITTWLLT